MQLIKFLAIPLFCVILFADTTGVWSGDGYSIEIAETSGAVTGVASEPGGIVLPISNGRIAGNTLTFETRTGPRDGYFYRGVLSSDQRSMTVSVRSQTGMQAGPSFVIRKN